MTSDAADLRSFLARIGEAADRREMGIWLVGGALRDLLLGLPTKDVDLAVEAGRRERPRAREAACRAPGLVAPGGARALRNRDARSARRSPRGPRGHAARGVPRAREPARRDGNGHDRRRPRAARLHDPRDGAAHLEARPRRSHARPVRRQARPRREDAPPPAPEVAGRRPDARVPRREIRGEAGLLMGERIREGPEGRKNRGCIRSPFRRQDEKGNRRDFPGR